MLERTPGKWIWAFSKDPETYGKPGIFVEGGDGEPLTPTIGDLELMAHAPEMHELLCRFAYCKHEDDMFDIMEAAQELIARINVKRQKEARR